MTVNCDELCVECEVELQDDYTCPKCHEVWCQMCGYTVDSDTRYCSECGEYV